MTRLPVPPYLCAAPDPYIAMLRGWRAGIDALVARYRNREIARG